MSLVRAYLQEATEQGSSLPHVPQLKAVNWQRWVPGFGVSERPIAADRKQQSISAPGTRTHRVGILKSGRLPCGASLHNDRT